MNALNLIPDERSDGYWLGSLSMAVAIASKQPDVRGARRVLRHTLDEFMRVGPASEELKRLLREELRR